MNETVRLRNLRCLTVEDLRETLAYLTMAEELKLVALRLIKMYPNYLVVQDNHLLYRRYSLK